MAPSTPEELTMPAIPNSPGLIRPSCPTGLEANEKQILHRIKKRKYSTWVIKQKAGAFREPLQ
jgi:hypothetical protein